MNDLDQDLKFYASIKPNLLMKSEGKWVLVHGQKLIGTFDSHKAAYEYGLQQLGRVSFLVKQVSREEPIDFIPYLSVWT